MYRQRLGLRQDRSTTSTVHRLIEPFVWIKRQRISFVCTRKEFVNSDERQTPSRYSKLAYIRFAGWRSRLLLVDAFEHVLHHTVASHCMGAERLPGFCANSHEQILA